MIVLCLAADYGPQRSCSVGRHSWPPLRQGNHQGDSRVAHDATVRFQHTSCTIFLPLISTHAVDSLKPLGSVLISAVDSNPTEMSRLVSHIFRGKDQLIQ